MDHFIPLSIPNFEGNEKKYVDDAVDQGWVSTGGAYITTLEDKLAKYIGSDDVAACQSGTSGLHLALVETGVFPGDMVIVPTLTFIAAVNPVRYQFAEPIFMDCDDSLCMDPIKLRDFCEKECVLENDRLIHNKTGKTIKAIIVVHVFGNMADMESIMDIAKCYHLKVIEDATEALGTKYTSGRFAGKFAGTIGDFGIFSFNGNKIITTGGGGAITARDAETVKHIRYLSTQAKDDVHYYIHNEVGYNYRMTNVQAAIGVAQMECIEEFVNRKQKNYEKYKAIFENFPYVQLLDFRKGISSNKWFYSIRIDRTMVNVSMRNIITDLEGRRIQTRAIWGLIHQQKPYVDAEAYRIKKAIEYSDSVLNIPCSTQLIEEEIQYVGRTICDVLTSYVGR